MSTAIRIRDLTSGDEHDVSADAGAYRVSKRDHTSSDPSSVDDAPGMGDCSAWELGIGEWAYVEFDDEGDADGAVVYWLSERVA